MKKIWLTITTKTNLQHLPTWRVVLKINLKEWKLNYLWVFQPCLSTFPNNTVISNSLKLKSEKDKLLISLHSVLREKTVNMFSTEKLLKNVLVNWSWSMNKDKEESAIRSSDPNSTNISMAMKKTPMEKWERDITNHSSKRFLTIDSSERYFRLKCLNLVPNFKTSFEW